MTDLETLKRIPILDYGEIIYGFTPVKARQRYWSFKEMDSMMISVEENKFWRNSTRESGSIVDFVMLFEGLTFSEALKKLELFLGDKPIETLPKRRKLKKPKFEAPKINSSSNSVKNYLCNERNISPTVLKTLMDEGYVYQEAGRRNAVFCSYSNGKMTYAQRCKTGRNIESHKRRFEVTGSDCTLCWRVENDSSTLVVGEAVIDMMSFMTLLEMQGKNYKKFDYLAMNGVSKTKSIFRAIEENQYSAIVLCLDNDQAGQDAKAFVLQELHNLGFCGQIIDRTPKSPNKDVNDILNYIVKNK